MKITNLTLLFFSLYLSIISLSNAKLIDMGDYAHDETTNMDWLKIDQTLGMSFNQVTEEINSGSLSGWQFARWDQFIELGLGLGSDDSTYSGQGKFSSPEDFIEALSILSNTSIYNNAGDIDVQYVGRLSYPSFYNNLYVHDWGLMEYTSSIAYNDIWLMSTDNRVSDFRLDDQLPNVGSWLVRSNATSVPETSTLVLLVLGALGFYSQRKRQ